MRYGVFAVGSLYVRWSCTADVDLENTCCAVHIFVEDLAPEIVRIKPYLWILRNYVWVVRYNLCKCV